MENISMRGSAVESRAAPNTLAFRMQVLRHHYTKRSVCARGAFLWQVRSENVVTFCLQRQG